MAVVAFIGLGNMGGPMAQNLVKVGHSVIGFDLSSQALERHKAAGGTVADTVAEAVKRAECVVTMLPSGKEVRALYSSDVFPHAQAGTVLIDSSTIDVDSARAVANEALANGLQMVDAPVSGGVGGAAGATLTFMCGGTDAGFLAAKPYLEAMGKTIIHAGGAGNGQAAKICNNMMLGIQMIATCEGFVLAEKLGLDPQKLFDIASKSSGQCWSLTSYCPVPGPVPTSPANRDYQPGFAAAMMLKDLKLAQDAARSCGATTLLGAEAAALYNLFVGQGEGGTDFSGIIRLLRGQ